MKKAKKVLIIIGLFLTYLFITMIVHQLQNDEIWGYGFTHNIYKGLIPYKDFNMVITPFFPFISKHITSLYFPILPRPIGVLF